MTGAAAQRPSYWTVGKFRLWTESRPSEERWELIDGVAILMTPPTLAHQRIALNLERFLNDALEHQLVDYAALPCAAGDLILLLLAVILTGALGAAALIQYQWR